MSNYIAITDGDTVKTSIESRFKYLTTTYTCDNQQALQIVLDATQSFMDYLIAYGYHYIFTDNTTETELATYLNSLIKYKMDKAFPTLYAMTNGFSELTSIPKEDSKVNTHDSTVDSNSLSENSPIDASYDMTTPYAKFKGSHSTATKDTYKDNTVGQAEKKQKIANGTVYTIQNFIENICRSFVHEFSTAF